MSVRPDEASSSPDERIYGGLADSSFRFLARHDLPMCGLVLVLATVGAIVCGQHKRLWFDELFTIFVAQQPTWQRFAGSLPPEGNPPLNTLLTRLSIHLFGLSALAVRLPILVGFLGAITGLYVFVRRECGPVYGLLAALLLISEPVFHYTYEARPYGLLLGFLLLAMVSWQSATRAGDATPQRPRGLALTGVAVGIAGCILSHNIGVVEVGVPLLFGEGARIYYRRRVDWAVLATGLAAIPALAITVPMARRTKALTLVLSTYFSPPITLHKVVDYFNSARHTIRLILNPSLVAFLLLVVLVGGLGWLGSRGAGGAEVRGPLPSRIPRHIWWAAIGASLLVPVTWVFMMSAGGWYFSRYGIGSVAGLAMIACFVLARRGLAGRPFVLLLLLVCGAWFATATVMVARTPLEITPAARLVAEDRSGLPIAAPDAFYYPELWWYAPASVKSRLFYVGDPEAIGKEEDSVVDVCLMAEKPYIDLPLRDFDTFVATEDHFLLLSGKTDWLNKRFEAAGYRISPVRTEGTGTLYDVRRGSPVAGR